MAVGLLMSAFAKSYSKEELYLQQKFKERLADLHAAVGKTLSAFFPQSTSLANLNTVHTPHKNVASVAGTPIMRAPTPGEGKVPVTLSKVQNIQPTNIKSET